MNKLGQFGIVLSILLFGSIINSYLNIAIPSSILGMITLLILLLFKIIKLEWVEDISNALLDNLSLLFVPPGVAIINELDIFRGKLIAIIFIIIISTIIVTLVTGYTVQFLIKLKKE